MLTPMFSLHYSEEYGRVATAFMRGAEHGYNLAALDTAERKDQQFKEFLNKIGRGEKWAAFERFTKEKNGKGIDR